MYLFFFYPLDNNRFRPIYLNNIFRHIQISFHIQHPIIPYPTFWDEICVRFKMERNVMKLKWVIICHSRKNSTKTVLFYVLVLQHYCVFFCFAEHRIFFSETVLVITDKSTQLSLLKLFRSFNSLPLYIKDIH